MYQIHVGDIQAYCANYSGPLFHAMLFDPPYHLSEMTKRYSPKNTKPPGMGRDGYFRRQSKGFMGQTWDGGDIAFRPETYEALSELLQPGGFMIAASGARTWHRMAVAMEDAGLILHPSIFMQGWAYGTGVPKGHKVKNSTGAEEFEEHHRYGLQTLKPALEPLLLAQKPYQKGRKADSITLTGAGTLDVLSTRRNGRYPANLVTLHTPECYHDGDRWVCDYKCPARHIHSQANRKPDDPLFFSPDYMLERFERMGGAFYVPKPSKMERESGLDVLPEITVNDGREKDIDNQFQRGTTQRRNPHPTLKPIKLMYWLATLLLPPDSYAPRRILVPFSGAGSEMIGAVMAGWEFVQGVELNTPYATTAMLRLSHWAQFAGWHPDAALKYMRDHHDSDHKLIGRASRQMKLAGVD